MVSLASAGSANVTFLNNLSCPKLVPAINTEVFLAILARTMLVPAKIGAFMELFVHD